LAFIAPVVEACARENELKNWVLTPFYLSFSIFILLLFFPRNAAYAGILAATVGDASSAIVGINLGKHRYMLTKGKSLEGSTAFFIVTLFGSLFFMDLNASVVVAIVATAAEIFSGEYDNITVPLSVGILAKHLTCV
jgi:dolichol kinase